MTACFKIMKALQPEPRQEKSLCEQCVYCSRNLEPAFSSSPGSSSIDCGLEFIPGEEKCIEMRTNNCGARKR